MPGNNRFCASRNFSNSNCVSMMIKYQVILNFAILHVCYSYNRIISNMIKINSFSFYKKPIPKEELVAISQDIVLITGVMERHVAAFEKHDLSALISLFTKDALIDSWSARRVVSLKEYEEIVGRYINSINSIALTDIAIKMENKNTATISGYSQNTFNGKADSKLRRLWKLRKINDKWLISETKYY